MILRHVLAAIAIHAALVTPATARELVDRVRIAVKGEIVLGFAQWGVSSENNPLVVVVSSKPEARASGQALETASRLWVFRDTGDALHRVGVFEGRAALLSQFLSKEENGLLITTWVSGSAFQTKVLAYSPTDRDVKVVLDIGSKGLPEIVYPFSAKHSLALTLQEYVPGSIGRPEASTPVVVYLFDDAGHSLARRTTWGSRFTDLE